jgi:hypothetical protein
VVRVEVLTCRGLVGLGMPYLGAKVSPSGLGIPSLLFVGPNAASDDILKGLWPSMSQSRSIACTHPGTEFKPVAMTDEAPVDEGFAQEKKTRWAPLCGVVEPIFNASPAAGAGNWP